MVNVTDGADIAVRLIPFEFCLCHSVSFRSRVRYGGPVRRLDHPRDRRPDRVHHGEHRKIGAGEGNRTLVTSLEDWSSTIELRPHRRAGPTAGRLSRL